MGFSMIPFLPGYQLQSHKSSDAVQSTPVVLAQSDRSLIIQRASAHIARLIYPSNMPVKVDMLSCVHRPFLPFQLYAKTASIFLDAQKYQAVLH